MVRGTRSQRLASRPRHFPNFLESRPALDFVEATSENFMVRGGRALAVLEKVRRDLPVALHGVSLSIGACDPLDLRYLDELDQLVRGIEPEVVSDHLCWGRHRGQYAHDLWPLPFDDEALEHVVRRVVAVQDRLRRQILLENVSSYVTFRASSMIEWEFMTEIARRSGCGILLDVNNVYDRVGRAHPGARSRVGRERQGGRDLEPGARCGCMTLAELQRAFWTLTAATDPQLVPTPELETTGRMEIYREMFLARQLELLRDDFPKLAGLIGAAEFAALAQRYLAADPSSHHSLARLGHALPSGGRADFKHFPLGHISSCVGLFHATTRWQA